jgi:hypothetical protein
MESTQCAGIDVEAAYKAALSLLDTKFYEKLWNVDLRSRSRISVTIHFRLMEHDAVPDEISV